MVLASGTGTLLTALLTASADESYAARVVAVVVDRPAAPRMSPNGSTSPSCGARRPTSPNRAAWDAAVTDAVARHEPALVVTAGS